MYDLLKKRIEEMADVREEPVDHMILELIAYCDTMILTYRVRKRSYE